MNHFELWWLLEATFRLMCWCVAGAFVIWVLAVLISI
jgi:hypothetical protein